jgi:hypothetical protein
MYLVKTRDTGYPGAMINFLLSKGTRSAKGLEVVRLRPTPGNSAGVSIINHISGVYKLNVFKIYWVHNELTHS